MRALIKPLRAVVVLAALTLTAACGGQTAAPPAERQQPGDPGATMTFGTSADPVVLDGALVSDGESLRAIDQMFDGLVALVPGTTDIEPALARSWEESDDGLEWTFQLRDDVTFHDGEPFDAAAVCFNFERWYNFEGQLQNPAASYYWQQVFGGFANPAPEFADTVSSESLYGGCEVVDEHEVTITLTRSSSAFLPALALTNFTMASPAALEEYNADEGSVDAEGIFRATGTFGTEHPIGTGAFRFREWIRNDRLVMERNPDYWGEFPGNIQTLIFRPIADNAARLQALQTGEIQGYDLAAPQDFDTIEADGNQLLTRPPFNVGYIGINQAIRPLDNPLVRQAIAHAINRQEIVDAFYPEDAEVAQEFMPPTLWGYAEDVTSYDYNPDRARELLTAAGLTLPVRVDFAYPTDVTRPYMPSPQNNFEAMTADLEAAGFQVERKSATWSPDYLDNVDNGRYGLYLLGWTGDIGHPDNFIGTFFQSRQAAWGFDNAEIFEALDEAEAAPNQEEAEPLYQEANRLIMDYLPGVPYVHSGPALAFAPNIQGYEPSPVSLEPFALVTVGGR